MRIIYVAGSYRGSSENEVFENIIKARQAALKLWRKGWCVICPHTNSMFMSSHEDEVEYLDGCLELVRRSDAIYMLEGWEKSEGARAEHELAKELDKEIWYQERAR